MELFSKKITYRKKMIHRGKRLRRIAKAIDTGDVTKTKKFLGIAKLYAPRFYNKLFTRIRKSYKVIRSNNSIIPEPIRGAKLAILRDVEYDTWLQHQEAFHNSPILKNYIEFLSVVPCGPEFLAKLPIIETKLMGSLMYYGNNDADFIPVPDSCQGYVAEAFRQKANEMSIFHYSFQEFQEEWNRICDLENIVIHIDNLSRFTVRRLIGEKVPKAIIKKICCWTTETNFYFYGLTSCNQDTWNITNANIDLHYKKLYPQFDEYGIGDGESAKLVATLMSLANCKLFHNLQSTDFILHGQQVNLTHFVDNGFAKFLNNKYKISTETDNDQPIKNLDPERDSKIA
jgi:hypothetical protein